MCNTKTDLRRASTESVVLLRVSGNYFYLSGGITDLKQLIKVGVRENSNKQTDWMNSKLITINLMGILKWKNLRVKIDKFWSELFKKNISIKHNDKELAFNWCENELIIAQVQI